LRDRWFFVFFVVSGFCALLCQVVWLRLAMAGFGVTAAMIAIVLSVFMAGLALGNAAGGWIVERRRSSDRTVLLLYAACELAVALSSRIVPPALGEGRALIAGAAWESSAYHLASALCVTVALLPFTVAMGATLPLALAAIGPRVRGGRSSVGHLYAANVLGAAAGTLAAALALIEILGLRGTLAVGASLNLLLAVLSLVLAVRAPSEPMAARAPAEGVGSADRTTLAALFATGFASMAMEVVWVRQFAPLLGNLVYAFAVILAAYLLATLAGSLFYRAHSASRPAEGPPAALWMALALATMLPAIAVDPRLGVPRFAGPEVVPLRAIAVVACAVAPLSAVLGFVTPWLVDRWSGGAARRAGAAWAINGLGCILGPLAGGFLLLPWAGERPALFLLALVPIGIGLMRAPRADGKAMAATTVAAAALLALTRGEDARFPVARVRRDSTATVIVTGEPASALLVNGVSMTVRTPITKFMAHLPLALLVRPARRGLVICFGMGTSFRSMHSWGIQTTAVELVPSVPKFFADFHPDAAAAILSSGRARIVIDDGRRFLDRSADAFDVVVVDPPPPVEAAGSSLLYSREFYRSLRPRLVEDGILQTWIPGGEPAVVAAFLLAVHDVFPYVRGFNSVSGWGIHVLASGRPIPDRPVDDLVSTMPAAARADLVAWGPFPTPLGQLLAVLDHEIPLDWEAYSRQAAPLADDRPVNEYYLLHRLSHRAR
jgi:spermidine synthase